MSEGSRQFRVSLRPACAGTLESSPDGTIYTARLRPAETRGRVAFDSGYAVDMLMVQTPVDRMTGLPIRFFGTKPETGIEAVNYAILPFTKKGDALETTVMPGPCTRIQLFGIFDDQETIGEPQLTIYLNRPIAFHPDALEREIFSWRPNVCVAGSLSPETLDIPEWAKPLVATYNRAYQAHRTPIGASATPEVTLMLGRRGRRPGR